MIFTDFYIVIRMWSPPEESNTSDRPKYVRRLETEGKPDSWTVTEDWKEAYYFKSGRVAGRILAGVDRLRTRIGRGWIYEIVKVTEDVLSTNMTPVTETEEAS